MRFQTPLSILPIACYAVANPISSRQGLTYSNIDAQATTEARALLTYIQSRYRSSFLSGQQERADVQWLKDNIGITPAIQGSDFMDYSPSRVERGTLSTATEDAIAFDHEGGIVTITWHWNAPSCLLDTAEKPWYSGFYTDATCFDVQVALAEGPQGADYKLLIRDIDAIAVQLQKLSDAKVPVLFRPLHEADGTWFWWGAKGAEPFKQLWDILYNRITNHHGIHNLVWVCNTEKRDWYVGNNKCDIATVDVYASAGDHNAQQERFNSLNEITGGERVLALGENGPIPDPARQASDNAPWAFWMTWTGDFVRDGNTNSRRVLQSIYSDSRVITLDGPTKLGNWKFS